MAQNDSPCLSDLWNLETIGIHDPIHVGDDDKALHKFNSTIHYQEGRYVSRKLFCRLECNNMIEM